MISYKHLRNLYYSGILFLVLYALPGISFIIDYVYPILQYEIIVGLPIISLIGIGVGIGAFAAYKYRSIG